MNNLNEFEVDTDKAAALALAEELLPKLREGGAGKAAEKLQELIDSNFVDPESGIEVDANKIMASMENVLEDNKNFDAEKLAKTFAALGRGEDPNTGENLHSKGTQFN